MVINRRFISKPIAFGMVESILKISFPILIQGSLKIWKFNRLKTLKWSLVHAEHRSKLTINDPQSGILVRIILNWPLNPVSYSRRFQVV